MMIEVLKSKIHCARVTEANLNYMGSITIDEDLLDAANMIAGEKVAIVDNNNGERFETYIIKGEAGRHCHHHVLCPDGLRGGQDVQADGRLPRPGDEQAGVNVYIRSLRRGFLINAGNSFSFV